MAKEKTAVRSFRECNLYTPVGTSLRKGGQMSELLHIEEAQIDVVDGIIEYVGPYRGDAPEYKGCDMRAYNLAGRVALPGFVDSHTHLPFAGTRPDEFMWRLRGDSYMSILERGGGILSTTKAVRQASAENLLRDTEEYIKGFSRMGITTFEGKSGYGLDHDAEIKQLQVLKEHNARACKPDWLAAAAPTYLGGHAVPPEYAGRADAYVDFMIAEMLHEIKEKGLAENCDIFCEKGVFTIKQSRRFLQAAKDLGFNIKIHADEIVWTGGAELAAELGALSADHLLHISEAGISALAQSGTVATLLPLTAFSLHEPYAPARKMIDAGCAVALATDFNPGSCFSYSIPLMIALATIHMGMTIEETITALTLNGAAALGKADQIGSIEKGKRGDIVVLDTQNINTLPYFTGHNQVNLVFKNGIPANQN